MFIIDNFGYLNDVLDNIGTEHYRLLASLSIQLENKRVMDLGTHKGMSAICLSYISYLNKCKSLDITTYDIIDILPDKQRKYFNKYEIDFRIQNLFDIQIREDNKNFILSQDIILIDIDPHEGILELDMYKWLKENNYRGVILFDDINLKQGHMGSTINHSMTLFWSKIPDVDKHDLTGVGHHSGTGLVSFNRNHNYKF